MRPGNDALLGVGMLVFPVFSGVVFVTFIHFDCLFRLNFKIEKLKNSIQAVKGSWEGTSAYLI